MKICKNKTIFQIFLTTDKKANLPQKLELLRQKVEQMKGFNEYALFGQEELESFIIANFGKDVFESFMRLKPLAYRADFGRYLLLYIHGGWYFDISVRPNRIIPAIDGLRYIVFRDAPYPNRHPWNVMNGLVFFEAESVVLRVAIELVLENIAKEFYGSSPLDPTGPGLLGRALAKVGSIETSIRGEYFSLTPEFPQKNFAFVLPSGEIFAWGKSTAGTPAGDGLRSFGAENTNSYSELYARREIYLKENS